MMNRNRSNTAGSREKDDGQVFDTGKKIQALKEALTGQLREQKEALTETLRRQEDARREETDTRTRQWTDAMDAVRGEIRKHDMAIEDMLDTWEEWRQEQADQAEALQRREAEQAREEAEALRGNQDALLALAETCCDQLFILKQAAAAAGDEAWLRQLALAETRVGEKALRAGFQTVGRTGDPFSYELHEPADVKETVEPERDMTLAGVYSQGYWYQGKPLRKAKVSVYQRKENHQA